MADVIVRERRQLLNVAYRLLGSLTDAEDVLQETFSRWYALSPDQRDAICSPGAWLTRVAGRICLDQLGSARVRREHYVGEWIPEPLPDREEWGDPAEQVTLDESVTMAFLVVLEQLTPAERVSFVLHDVFRYPFAEIAEIVGRSPAACRQLATSARRRLSQRVEAPVARQADVVRDFRQAWEAKDVQALVALLDPSAVMIADGGGLASTALKPIEGGEQIARYLVGIARNMPELTILDRSVNGRPGLVATRDDIAVTVAAFEVADDRITRIWAVRNPDKLTSWSLRARS